jgi:hypothetical protein
MNERILAVIGEMERASFSGVLSRSELSTGKCRDALRELKDAGLIVFQDRAYQLSDWGRMKLRGEGNGEQPEQNEAAARVEDPDADPLEEKEDDPVLAKIDALPSPQIPEAAQNARRLRALAAWPLLHPTISWWLKGLADDLEETAGGQ